MSVKNNEAKSEFYHLKEGIHTLQSPDPNIREKEHFHANTLADSFCLRDGKMHSSSLTESAYLDTDVNHGN